MKTYEVEFSAVVTIEADGDTVEIVKAAFIAFEKKLKSEKRKKKDLREMFFAMILQEK